jgi:hypothetical protein
MRVGSLRDDVFLLSHEDDGRLTIAEPAASAGLAGAMLIELLLDRRVAVVDGRLDVIDSAVTGDASLDATLEAIAGNDAPTGPRAWVSWIAPGTYEGTAAALEAAGLITRSTVRRLGLLPVARCVPTKPDDLVRLRARLRYGVSSAEMPDAATAALAGLVRALRLESSLLLSMPTADLLAALERLAAGNTSAVRHVIKAVGAIVSAATYR